MLFYFDLRGMEDWWVGGLWNEVEAGQGNSIHVLLNVKRDYVLIYAKFKFISSYKLIFGADAISSQNFLLWTPICAKLSVSSH